MSKKTTIKDIAKKTSLSTTTVSRVLNGKSEKYRIAKTSQEIIEAAALELNYVANHFAANLKSGKSNTIGLIIPSLSNPFFANIASKINSEVRKFGYTTIIADSDENVEIEKTELQQFVSRNIEGLIIIPCGKEMEHIEQVYQKGLPMVLLDRYFEGIEIPFVSTDNFEGAFMAANLLINHGHNSILCIQGVIDSTPNKMRIKGFKQAMKDAGIDDFKVVGDAFSSENGYLETKMLLQNKIRPTAIFTLSNTIAMGCLKALKEENIRIPQDISLITFDDHLYLDYLATPITSVAQPVEIICKLAMKNLMSALSNKEEKTIKQVILKPEIKYRESVSRINIIV
ncbi:LacI family DNA-binding transcriptional regulator [Flavivirga spongiicola]|uniref:LacI family transcriptional regulator n=1 Tax=Flavivirga spongiicola TaxID=421621 RepID=A0ABU7XP23_9FLAO|nr:LacI family DNA-binding transcriptional regulator [Flavivirga sp. MEBiC05379]MDO5977517.1 LacI family DNA-binding transcriptional regulator [Flavivirga sp. MEBiC05379]